MGVADPLTHIDLEMHTRFLYLCVYLRIRTSALYRRESMNLPGSFPPELFSRLLVSRDITFVKIRFACARKFNIIY